VHPVLCVRLLKTGEEDRQEFSRGESWQPKISDTSLVKAFSKFGEVSKVTVSRETQDFVAFVEMRSFLEAYHSFKWLDNAIFGKYRLNIQFLNLKPCLSNPTQDT